MHKAKKACDSCGAPQEQGQTKFCHECGKSINQKAEICPECGVRQQTGEKTEKTTDNVSASRGIAALLAFFLGGLGIHKFYMNRPGEGLVYILFFWTFIPGLIAFIEGIIYIVDTNEQFAQRCK